MKIDKYLYISIIIISLYSCGPTSEELSAEERYTLDTIFNKKQQYYRLEADSICKSIQDTYYTKCVDSIKKQYKEEINALMGVQRQTE
ncbi:MAG: hypothetical protein R2774_11750 [Saprospiraceae bacterium]